MLSLKVKSGPMAETFWHVYFGKKKETAYDQHCPQVRLAAVEGNDVPVFGSIQERTDCPLVIFSQCFCYCCSVPTLCPAHFEPMNHSTPGFPVLHHLLKFSQTYVR